VCHVWSGPERGHDGGDACSEHALVVPALVEVTETVAAKSGAAANDPIGLDVLAENDGAWTE